MHLYLSGYLGYLNLLQMAGQPDDATIRGYYTTMLSGRTSQFNKNNPYWPDSQYGGGGESGTYTRTLAISRNVMFLTPEIAGLIRTGVPQSKINEAINEYNYVAPYWFVNKFDATIGESTLDHLYNLPSLFQAKAWILQEPRAELLKYLDAPAFQRGDLFYIQNLGAALDTPKDGAPTSTPSYSLDSDTDIDIYDILILISRFTQNLVGDFNQNGRIDIFDFNMLLRQ